MTRMASVLKQLQQWARFQYDLNITAGVESREKGTEEEKNLISLQRYEIPVGAHLQIVAGQIQDDQETSRECFL